jgi:UDP-N-acetylmuramyl tripeptide synthase
MARFTLNDSRRLTGENLYWDRPSAIIDIDFESGSGSPDALLDAWQSAAKHLIDDVGLQDERLTHRVFDGGASLLISAPIDALYSMCELNEVAFAMALAEVDDGPSVNPGNEADRLVGLFAEEACPPVLRMQAAAARQGAPFLWDDDEVSVGYGKTALVWPSNAVPDPETIDWDSVKSIPVGLVTGTNGKSTTVRMSASIIRAAGLSAGLTSTDWIRVGSRILDDGDYSGPGGARTLMRHPETEIAVLEVARGGLLRRGLGVERAAAALVTNVAADHLGEYGINTVAELTEAKFIVRRALKGDAPLILNADDERSRTRAQTLEQKFADHAATRLIWFSLDADNPVLKQHLADGGRGACLNQGWLELRHGNLVCRVIQASDIPATMNGAARHNISNALAAIALCRQLGIDDESLRNGLAVFRGDEADNPGRGNWFERDGVRILVDFAHNEHGVTALADMVGHMEAERRVLLMGQAGDRSDADIRDLTLAGCRMSPDHLMISEMPGYERGREVGEAAALIRSAALESGISGDSISYHASPSAAAQYALEKVRPGDLLILLALTQRQEVLDLVHRFIEQ